MNEHLPGGGAIPDAEKPGIDETPTDEYGGEEQRKNQEQSDNSGRGGRSPWKKRLLWAGLAFVILLGIGFGLRHLRQEAPVAQGSDVVPVEVTTVKTGDVRSTVKLTGNVVPRSEVNLVPKIPGRIQMVTVDVGDSVEAGQLLVKLDDAELQAALQTAEAAVEVAKASARAADANLADAEHNLKRMQQLYTDGAISLQQLEQAQLRYDQAAAGVSNAQVRQAEAAVESTRVQLDNTCLVAPINGVVAARFADPGEMASSVQPLLTLVDLSEVKVTGNITEGDINTLALGQSVPIKVAAAGTTEEEQIFTGKITSLAPAADERSKLFPIEITIPNPENRLKPGMFAEIQLTTAERKDVVRVPVDIVQEKDGQKIVYILEKGKARERQVETGLAGVDYVEIKSGLQPGNQLIVTGQEFLVDGTKVKVSASKASGTKKGAAR